MTDTTIAERAFESVGESRARRLRALTHDTHERLDRSIMAASAFSDLERYGRFVEVQYLFHRDIAALYEDEWLRPLLPDLAGRNRLPLFVADLADLGRVLPEADDAPRFSNAVMEMSPAALGWLYVAEGSRMGGAMLRKAAEKLGLSDTHGARHLAPSPEGPAAQWRAFTTALDAVDLGLEEEGAVVSGAQAAFSRMQTLVDARLG